MAAGNVDGAAVGDILGSGLEGRDRTGQRSQTYELAEQLLRHLHANGLRGPVRLVLELDEAAWAKYRSEVQRPFRAEPRVTVVPVDGVGMLEFRRAGGVAVGVDLGFTSPGVVVVERPARSWSEGGNLCRHCAEVDCNGDECRFAWVCVCGLGWPADSVWRGGHCANCGRDVPEGA